MKEELISKLKTELVQVYLTSDDKTFLSREEALIRELELFKDKENKDKENKMNNDIYNLIAKILAKNDWGLYFKGEPLQSLPIQDGCKMFKVNDVNLDALHGAVMSELNQEGQSETWENKSASQNSESSME
jgi:hypothetical protein